MRPLAGVSSFVLNTTRISMKRLLIISALLINLSACGQHQGHGHDGHGDYDGHHGHQTEDNISIPDPGPPVEFPVVGFRKTHTESIPFPVDQVFPFFEPQGRPLLYEKWDPTVLKTGENNSLKGHVEFSKYDDLDVFLTVTEYDRQAGHIQYMVIWDDFEIQRIDIYCNPGDEPNSTQVTWDEHNAGLYDKGVSLVTMFVEGGYLVKVVERYLNNVEKQLAHGK